MNFPPLEKLLLELLDWRNALDKKIHQWALLTMNQSITPDFMTVEYNCIMLKRHIIAD